MEYKDGELYYIANFQTKNTTPGEETDGAHTRSIVNMFDCLILSYILKTFIQRKLRLLIILVILPEKITNST